MGSFQFRKTLAQWLILRETARLVCKCTHAGTGCDAISGDTSTAGCGLKNLIGLQTVR